MSATPSKEILEAALHGLEAQRTKLDEQIANVRGMLGGRASRQTHTETPARNGRKKRVLTAEARKRIAAAQKKRWANFRKTQS